jgi:hypothetical protein
MSDIRRRFERLSISEDALALDQAGQQLGRVSQVSGGGFLIYPASTIALQQLPVGRRLTITVVEPKSNSRNSVDVEVRYHKDTAVGVSFVGGNECG